MVRRQYKAEQKKQKSRAIFHDLWRWKKESTYRPMKSIQLCTKGCRGTHLGDKFFYVKDEFQLENKVFAASYMHVV